jgi:hypothetical protein
VDQGELNWQPVRLPREEEHLGELSLGLKTIDAFDAPVPAVPAEAAASVEATAPAAPVRSVAPADVTLPEAPVSSPDPGEIAERRGPVPVPVPKPGAVVAGNKSAFQLWLEQLGGGRG